MAAVMTSRERLLGAMRRQPVDRVPISTYEMVGWDPGNYVNTEPSYARLAAVIREKTDCLYIYSLPSRFRLRPPDPVQTRILELPDGRETHMVTPTPRGPLTSTHVVKRDVLTTWHTEHWLKTEEDVRRYQSLAWAPCETPPDYESFHAMDRALGEHGLPAPDLGDAFCAVAELFSFEDFLVLAQTQPQPELIEELVAAEHARVMANLKAALDHGWHGLFRIYGSEFGSAPYLPPRAWARLEQPYLKEMIGLIHAYPNCFARLHSHGRYRGLLDLMAACAPDALDPCEPPPDGDMTLAELKAAIGDRVCFMGAMELRMLETATPEVIRAEVKRSMDMAKAGGGYIALPTASPINVPLSPKTEANYFTWIDANLEYGRYD